jgi:hypothetical protein
MTDELETSCPACHQQCSLLDILPHVDICWPYKRWARATCPFCGEHIYLLPGFEKVTVGTVDTSSDAKFVPHDVLEPWDYSSWWSAGGLRISINEDRWTIRASDLLW